MSMCAKVLHKRFLLFSSIGFMIVLFHLSAGPQLYTSMVEDVEIITRKVSFFRRANCTSNGEAKDRPLAQNTTRTEVKSENFSEHCEEERVVSEKVLKSKDELQRKTKKEASVLISYPTKSLRFPASLKKKDPSKWTSREQMWMNVTHYPWPNDPKCKDFSVRFAKPHSYPVRGLISYPSSGNTWTRYLTEGASGTYTGSVYNDPRIMNKGMYGESVSIDSGMTLFQKAHGCSTLGKYREALQRKNDYATKLNCSAILLIRSPFSALVSRRNLDVGGHIGIAPRHHFEGIGWESYVKKKIVGWADLYTCWLELCPSESLLIVHYENIMKDAERELSRIMEFVGASKDPKRMLCVLKHSEGPLHRKYHPDRDNIYPEPLFKVVEKAMIKLNRTLMKYKKESLPVHLYPIYTKLLNTSSHSR